jgi:hypothetical protein
MNTFLAYFLCLFVTWQEHTNQTSVTDTFTLAVYMGLIYSLLPMFIHCNFLVLYSFIPSPFAPNVKYLSSLGQELSVTSATNILSSLDFSLSQIIPHDEKCRMTFLMATDLDHLVLFSFLQ